MPSYVTLLNFLLLTLKLSSEIKFNNHSARFASVHNVYENLHKKWLFLNKIEPSVQNIIKEELLSQIKAMNLEKRALSEASSKLDSISLDISRKILDRKKKFHLKNLFVLEDVKESSFLRDLAGLFTRNPVVYSIWNFNRNILSQGGDLVLEIQYRFPINIKRVPKFYFSPIVTYKSSIHTGKYDKSRFSEGVIKLHTHPFFPWKTHTIGSFTMYPPLFSLNLSF